MGGRTGIDAPALANLVYGEKESAMSSRPRGPLMRAAIILAVAAVALSSQLIQPLMASAQVVPAGAGSARIADGLPTTKPQPWSPASARPARHPQQKVNAAALRAQAIAQVGATEKIASYRVSPAVLAFLNTGLGLRLGASSELTGTRSGHTLRISLPAPAGLRLGLPAGVSAPSFSRSTLVIDTTTGAATLTSTATGGTLRVAIGNTASGTLATGTSLTGDVTLRVPVLGETTSLNGPISYPAKGGAATASLSGRLPASAVLEAGAARFDAGATVTLSTNDGLRVDGPAVLGRPGHQLTVTMDGAISGKDWTFTVSRSASASPLPGLTLSGAASGTVLDDRGAVSYDVHASTARAWTAVPGAAVSGAVEFSNELPGGSVIPAPGLAGKVPWIDVNGTVSLASGGDTVAARGTATINLASGKGLLFGSATAPVSLGGTPDKLVLDQAGFRGPLNVGNGVVTGSVRGTGRVMLSGAGKPVQADAALTLTPAGSLVAGFPVDRSVLGLGTQGHEDTAYWASAAAPGFTGQGHGVRLSLPAGLSATAPSGTTLARPQVVATATTTRSVNKELTADASPSSSYTLSSATYNFLTNTLNIPLGSATLTGTLSGSTLTVTASAPTQLPSSLPSWIGNPTYVNTQIVVDESDDSLTLTAATGTTSGLTATLSVAIASVSTASPGISGSLSLDGVPFTGGSTASLKFGLGYASGALTANLAGTLTYPATFGNGLVTIPVGATITLGTGTGVSVSGMADINYGSGSAEINVTGTLTDLSNWSLNVSDANAPPWQPTANLSITPDFTGTISDTAGSFGFDLATAPGSVVTWSSPDQASSVSVTGLELSNLAPSGTAKCTSAQVSSGDLWAGIGGQFSYAPTGTSINVGVTASGCLDLSAGSATITTAATGSLTAEFGSALPFSVTAAGLTASLSTSGKYSLTGTATVVINASGATFNAGLSLSNDGIVGGVQVSLGSLGLPGSGAGFLYVSSAAMNNFDPGTFGFSGQPLNLPQGLVVGLGGQLPANFTTALQKVIPTFPSNATIQGMASLSTTGFSASLTVALGTTTGGVQVFSDNGASFYLDDLGLTFAVSTSPSVTVTVSATGYAQLPALDPGVTSPSSATVTFSGSLTVSATPSLSVALGFSNWGSTGVLGIQGLSASSFGGSFGVTLDGEVPVPTMGFYADGVQLPAQWASTIGMVPGAQISFNVNLSTTQPVFSFMITGEGNQPALTPLAIDTSLSPTVINSFTVSKAGFDFAPAGGTDPGTGDQVSGAALSFYATVDGVRVNVAASVDLTTPTVTAYVSSGPFTLGNLQVGATDFFLDLSPTDPSFGFTAGASYQNNSFYTTVYLEFGSTMNDGAAYLTVTGGLPSYLTGYVTLSGMVSGDGGQASVNAYGTGSFYAGGTTLGPVSFSLSIPNGTLSWTDYDNSITQIAQFFVNAGTSAGEIVQILQSLGYDTYDIINALGDIGDYSSTWISDLAAAFGFSSTYYDIWNATSSGQRLVLDVSGGSQSPSAPVITWQWNGGSNQDWAFVQSPYSGWYNIVNENSGQCLTVQYNTDTPGNPLIQYPCNGGNNQLWYMGTNIEPLIYNYVITSALNYNEVIDISGAYQWQGGSLDLWPYNGGWNQVFYLTNSSTYPF